ncbi:MAG: protein translocase subunit SecF [Patescibacteria group bacterium]
MRPVYKIFFVFSVLLTISALVVAGVVWSKTGGSFLSADFRGGSVLELKFEKGRPSEAITIPDATVLASGDTNIIIRSRTITDEKRQEIITTLSAKHGPVTQQRFDNIGPIVGKELKTKSIQAVVILLAAIIIYISFVFRSMSRVLSPWALGIAAVFALLHDLIIPIGVFSLLGYYGIAEIGAVFVAAALTILGYSVSDTVVVFDRVRENVIRYGSKESFPELMHKSIMQTLTRSINTSMTTLLSLLAIFFFGGESIKYFALALIIGIVAGTYSSIFVASPIVVWWHQRRKKA